MTERKRSFLSADKKTKIHVTEWMPEDGECRAILQITHGMQEYIDRYRTFAEYLTAQGIGVAGHDHLGHGDSVCRAEDYGYIAEKHPGDILVRDMHTLRRKMQKEHKGVPYFMLGHSMGSYLLRRYIAHYGEGLQGVLLVGTGSMPDISMLTGMALCRVLAAVNGWHYKSPFIKRLSFAGPYRQYDVTGKNLARNWLTGDLAIAEAYYRDPKCRFDFTINGYYALMESVYLDNRPNYIRRIPKDLPVYLLSGGSDPVGNMGKGVCKVYRQYCRAGLQNVQIRLYEEARHELLNETMRQDVFREIVRWMSEQMKSESKEQSRK